MSANITKHISFPPALFMQLEANAKNFGVSVAEYLRHLAMNDISQKRKSQNIVSWENNLPNFTATDQKWQEWDNAENEKNQIMTSDQFNEILQNV